MPEFFAPAIAILLLAVIFATVFSFATKRKAQRKDAMQTLSNTMAATYSEEDSYGLAQQLNGFDLFSRRHTGWLRNGSITNVMRSTVGETEVFLFDYTYMVSTGKSSHRIAQTVFFANDKKWYLPNFRMKPERWWHKLMSSMGMARDINFEENSDFSEKFWLKSEFESLVRQKFTPELQAFMLEKPPVNLEGENYYLLAYKPGKLLNPQEAKTFFENCCALTRLMQTEGRMELLELVELKEAIKREA